MDYRGLVVASVIVSAAVLPLLPACTAPDPGQITFVPRTGASNPADENGDQSSSGNAPPSASSSSSSGTATVDAGGDQIFGTQAFTYTDPGETANGQPAPHAPPMQGQACGQAGCHGDPGAAGPKWVGAGTVFADATGTQLPQGTKVELQIVDPKTNTVVGGNPFFADSDGNFWLDAAGTTIPDGALVGVRKEGGQTMIMTSPTLSAAAGSNCNAAGCHATTKIYVQ